MTIIHNKYILNNLIDNKTGNPVFFTIDDLDDNHIKNLKLISKKARKSAFNMKRVFSNEYR